MISWHPPADLLLDYASGNLSEGVALAVVTHSALCPDCHRQIVILERLAGDLLDRSYALDIAPDALARALDRLDQLDEEPSPPPVSFDAETMAIVPSPLRRYMTDNLNRLPWKRVGRMYQETRLPLRLRSVKASLLRLRPGSAVPRHSHHGFEYTVVLAGGFKDNVGQYIRGDFALRDPSHEHQPVVDADEECICLAVLDAPIKLPGLVGRLLSPFLRI